MPHSPGDEFPAQGRLAAIDYGTVRIGVAICDPDRILASPHAIHRRGTLQSDQAYFCRLADEERIAGFVVGLPIHCDGGESAKSLEARRFARWLAEVTERPVRLFDERFTTAAASERLRPAGHTRQRKKDRLDAVAALVLLEAFLEAIRYGGRGLPGEAPETPPQGGAAL
jgi:putative holliday junction resolvase